MITPNSTYEFDFVSSRSTLIKQQEIPSGYDKTKYVTERVWATARDGVKVPIIIMMKKGTKLDGSAPMLPLRLRLVRSVDDADTFRPPGFRSLIEE